MIILTPITFTPRSLLIHTLKQFTITNGEVIGVQRETL